MADDPTRNVSLDAAAPPIADPETENILEEMWTSSMQEIRDIDPDTENWKIQTLPLARIKKIMKSEEFIMQELEKERLQGEGQSQDDKPAIKFMISAEAPLLMSKACELLIKEISSRAWQHTERNRRRTLQRQDVHAAVGESEVYDFLIDIVPRVASSARGSGQQAPPPAPPPPPPAASIPQPIPEAASLPPNLTIPNIANVFGAPASLSNQGGGTTDLGIQDPMAGGTFNPSLFYAPLPALDGADGLTSLNLGIMQPQQHIMNTGQPQQQQPHQQQQHQPQQQGSIQTTQWTDPPPV